MDILTTAAMAALLGTVVLSTGVLGLRLWRAATRERQPLLMHRVLERGGVSLDDCTDVGTFTRLGVGARRCLLCRDRKTCIEWLNGDTSLALDEFCPNADLIRSLRKHELPLRAPAELPQTR